MPACPHCRESVSGQPGVVMLCPYCGGRLRIYRRSPVRRSIPRVTSTGPKLHSRPVLRLQPIRRAETSDWVKTLEYKPTAVPTRPTKADKISPQSRHHFSFGEIDESSQTIIFNLPLDEDQLKWEIEGNILKVKSLRFDYQYKEEVKIPDEWIRGAEPPEVKFLNGVLAFSWGGEK